MRKATVAIIAALLLSIVSAVSNAAEFDREYTAYSALLQKYVADGLVDYKLLMNDKNSLTLVANGFNELTRSQINQLAESDQVAFWINAYNFYTIRAIIDHYPVESIKAIRGVWNRLEFRIAQEMLTLDNIEHDILRKDFAEPRIHVAIVCASISCPELWDRPFIGDSLDYQLAARSFAFVNDTTRNRIENDWETIRLSKILNWYGDDFVELYGGDQKFKRHGRKKSATINFVYQHLDSSDKNLLLGKSLRVKYLDYDWALNGR